MTLRALARARFRPAGAHGPAAPSRDTSSAGFTLIELVIVAGVLPIVIGALAVGTIAVFSLQGSVSNRLTDSGDAQIVSLHFQNDVQSAALMTTSNSAVSPAPCGTGFQVLGLQLGNENEISYTTAAAPTGGTYQLTRNVCSGGSVTPSTSVVIARDLPSSVITTSPVTLPQCPPPTSSNAAACDPGAGGSYAYQNGWVSTVGVTGVSFQVQTPPPPKGSGFNYQVTAVPAAGANTTNLAPVATPSTGCGFATPATGTYASTLCFVNFAPWNSQTGASSLTNYCQSGLLPISAAIASTPFTLNFCMSISATGPGGPITGQTSAGPACGVAARSGYNDITASPLPTYACPPDSEAFLGNNGFYTGVPGDPALYEVTQGSSAIIKISQIEVVSSNGQAATNWELVTGDAESTDPGESIQWTSNQNLSLLPNTTNSAVGNACNQTPGQATNTTYLSGLGTPSVTCSTTISTDKTGTVMLQATTPNSLTVTLVGTGLQAMFLGVLLP